MQTENNMAKELIIVEEKTKIPTNWNYSKSVEIHKNLFKEVREKGSKALIELKIAHQILTKDSKKKKDRKYPDKTFKGYCSDIEIGEKTAYRWLHKYFPDYLPMLLNDSIPLKEIDVLTEIRRIRNEIDEQVDELIWNKIDVGFALKELSTLHNTGESDFLTYPKIPGHKMSVLEHRNWLATIDLYVQRKMGKLINVLVEAGALKL